MQKQKLTNEKIICELLEAKILLCNFLRYSYHSNDVSGKTICLFVNCHDLFTFGSENSEEVDSEDELHKLYKSWKEDKGYGVDIWCCHKRDLQPQSIIKDIWKKNGVWNDELEKLRVNPEGKKL